MSAGEKKREIFLARPQRAGLRFPRGWNDICETELLSLLRAPLTPQPSAARIAAVRSGFELRGVSLRALCELPLRARTLRELVWLIDSGSAVSKEVLAETIAAGPLHWLIGSAASVKVRAASQRSRLFHTGLIESEIESVLARQGVRIGGEETADVQIYAELWRDNVTLGIGLGGTSLGKRGYKIDLRSPASIKEELGACCIDGFRQWIRGQMGEFSPDLIYVPFAGSGTLAVEALLAWGEIAPARFGRSYAMESLAGAPTKSIQHARKRLQAMAVDNLPRVVCVERDREQVQALRRNVTHVSDIIGGALETEVIEADWFDTQRTFAPGTKIFLPLNPPYGERLSGGDSAGEGSVVGSYRRIGAAVKGLRRNGVEIAGLLLCPDASTRRAFLDGSGGGAYFARPLSHGGIKMEVLYFAGAR